MAGERTHTKIHLLKCDVHLRTEQTLMIRHIVRAGLFLFQILFQILFKFGSHTTKQVAFCILTKLLLFGLNFILISIQFSFGSQFFWTIQTESTGLFKFVWNNKNDFHNSMESYKFRNISIQRYKKVNKCSPDSVVTKNTHFQSINCTWFG